MTAVVATAPIAMPVAAIVSLLDVVSCVLSEGWF